MTFIVFVASQISRYYILNSHRRVEKQKAWKGEGVFPCTKDQAATALETKRLKETIVNINKRKSHIESHDNADVKDLRGGSVTNHYASHHLRDTFT